jgi:hypothetical protein
LNLLAEVGAADVGLPGGMGDSPAMSMFVTHRKPERNDSFRQTLQNM